MRVVVLDTAPVLGGTLIYYGLEGGTNVQIGFDLAAARSDAENSGRERQARRGFFQGSSPPLKRGEPVVFAISVFAGPFTYTWELEVDVVINGKAESRRVRAANNQPFKVTGYRCQYDEIWGFGDETFWETQDPATFHPRICQNEPQPG